MTSPGRPHADLSTVRSGTPLMVQDASGTLLPATAASALEGTHRDGRKIHDFPVVYVVLAALDRPVPWPAEYVTLAEEVTL